MTHLLHAHDFQIGIASPNPSSITLWTFPPGRPWATRKYPNQLFFLSSLSQLVAPLSTQSPKLQPGEPSLTSVSHLSPTSDYRQFYPSEFFLHTRIHGLGAGPPPFSPGLLHPSSMSSVFLLVSSTLRSPSVKSPERVLGRCRPLLKTPQGAPESRGYDPKSSEASVV